MHHCSFSQSGDCAASEGAGTVCIRALLLLLRHGGAHRRRSRRQFCTRIRHCGAKVIRCTQLRLPWVGGWGPGPERLDRGGQGLQVLVEEAIQRLLLALDGSCQFGQLPLRG